MNSYFSSFCIQTFLVAVITFGSSGVGVASDSASPTLLSMADATAYLTQVVNRWSIVQTLKYEVDTKDIESDGFKKSINESGHDRDVLLTHLDFTFKGSDYGWRSDTLVEATGVHEDISIGGRTNGMLSVLFQGPRSLLMVTKDPNLQSSIPTTGRNPLMEAFSFLVSDDWRGLNCPELDLDSLLSKDVLANAVKRITSFSNEIVQSKSEIKIVFGPASGSHDVVYFSGESNGFPVDWQHFEGSYLRRETSISDGLVTKIVPGGGSIVFPHLLTRRDYYDPSNPNVFCTSEQTLNVVAINQVVADDDLVIDPSLADTIYDRDNNKRIAVPR